jgi:uncharacterized membrane protein
MSKEQFLLDLQKHLKRLPQEEIDNALRYYEEYLDEVGIQNEENAIASFGNPHKLASQIVAEYAVKDMEAAPSAKKTLSSFWAVLLAVFASPIAIPLAIAATCVVLALVVVVIALIFSLAVISFSFAISFIVVIAVGIILLVPNPAVSIFYIGIALFLLGVGIMFSQLTRQLTKKFSTVIPKIIRKSVPRRLENEQFKN